MTTEDVTMWSVDGVCSEFPYDLSTLTANTSSVASSRLSYADGTETVEVLLIKRERDPSAQEVLDRLLALGFQLEERCDKPAEIFVDGEWEAFRFAERDGYVLDVKVDSTAIGGATWYSFDARRGDPEFWCDPV